METLRIVPADQCKQELLWPSSAPSSIAASETPSMPANPTQGPHSRATSASKFALCEYPGCTKNARYGLRNMPPIACQAHKRAGQYTINRHGVLLMATKDGHAFQPAVVPASPTPEKVQSTGTASAPDQSQRRSAPGIGGGRSPSSSRLQKSARQSPTSSHTFKRMNRPASFDGDGVQEVEDRPCLFPGCDARPTCGLPGATRAVYCFSHKKASMAPVLKKSTARKIQGKKSTAIAVAAKEGSKKNVRALPTVKTAHKKGSKKARYGLQVEEEGGGTAGDRGSKQGSHKSVSKGKKVQVCAAREGASPRKGEHPWSTPSAKATPGAKVNKTSEITTAGAAMPPPPPSSTNRLVDASEMSPSDEYLVLKQAREAAKKEAEAIGGGRRPRVPSRRALEASGRMKGEGAQWMTREIKEKQTKMNNELREQRKQYMAAGLKMGVVLEAFVGTVEAAPSTPATATGTDVVTSGGGGGGAAGAEPVLNAGCWQKVSPAML